MKKVLLFLLIAFATLSVTAQNNRLFDHPMQMKALSVTIQADCFTAVTFLEFEFYNPNDTEIEGLYRFTLAPSQVITGFQLELNGRYRNGSIEEKWKARNAYNTIVGKRIDPALLTKEYGNNYRLNIYPVPTKGSRRVTITIHQKLAEEQGKLKYDFGFNKADTARQFKLSITTKGCATPLSENGLIANDHFIKQGESHQLNKSGANVALWPAIRFSFPVPAGAYYCTQQANGQTFFALKVQHQIPFQTALHPKNILVYWDVSLSSTKRKIEKEISFLKQYMQKHKVEQLAIIAFAEEATPAKVFRPQRNMDWIGYLQSLEYDGATRIDQLNFADPSTDAVFLFTDGYISYGNRSAKDSNKPLFAVASSAMKDSLLLKSLIGISGGSFIDLSKHTVPAAIEMASHAENQLLSIQSASGKTSFSTTEPGKDSFLVYGVLPVDDTLTFVYGNRTMVHKKEQMVLKKDAGCTGVGIDRLAMLQDVPSSGQWNNWENVLEFGLREKIVTANTAYIVLERVEDYVKYNITPPEELEEECKQQGFITKNTKTLRQQLREMDEYDILKGVVDIYNYKLRQWDGGSNGIALNRDEVMAQGAMVSKMESSGALTGSVAGLVAHQSLNEEVVVTGYSMARRKIGFADVGPFRGNKFEQLLQGRVAGLMVSGTGDGTTIRIRGINSLSGANSPLYVLDGFPVGGNINDVISVNDIESITVLKDAAATAFYGSRAANGVIVITTKKYSPSRTYSSDKPYRLRDMEDEDYLQEMKTIPVGEKLERYYILHRQYSDNATFYIAMAQHLFESGFRAHAMKIVFTAAEVSNGDQSVLRAIAYTFEWWKKYDRAIEIYRQLLSMQPGDLSVYRELAWALYQDNQIQESVQTFYNAIKWNLEMGEPYKRNMKAVMLNEMNAVIAIHKDKLDLSGIPAAILSAMPVDMRIVLCGNVDYIYGMKVKEPNGKETSWQAPVSKNGGYMDVNRSYFSYTNEYNIRNAIPGKYRISLVYNDYYRGLHLPKMVRIIYFKNFGRKDQSISIQNVIMNNQDGTVEIGEVEW